MAANKSKKQFQGKNRRFRGDVWLDEKVSGRTMHALQERGVKFPPGTNVRGTREFKDEYKKQLKLFRQEHAAKIAAKKERYEQRMRKQAEIRAAYQAANSQKASAGESAQ